MTLKNTTSALALSGLALLLQSESASAQDAQPNWDYRFESQLRVDDNAALIENPEDSATFWINEFGVANRSRTRTSAFDLDLSGHVRVQNYERQDETVRFDDPTLRLAYSQDTGDDSIALSIFANQVDLEFFDALRSAPVSSNDLDFDDTRGDGRRQAASIRLSGTVNETAPLSFVYDLSAFQRNFIDTTEDDLNDRTEYRASGSVLFDITRTVRGVLDLGLGYTEIDNGIDEVRRSASSALGVDARLDETTELQFRLGYSESRTEDNLSDTDDVENGVIGSVAATRDVGDGVVSASYSVDVNENGQRERLRAGRTFERNETEFGGNLGLTSSEVTDNIRPIGDLFITTTLPRAQLSARLVQDASVDDDGNDSIFTRLLFSYDQDLTSDFGFTVDLVAGRRFEDESENVERRRFDATASVRQRLNDEWNFRAGYEYVLREEDDGSFNASSNRLFAAIVRPLQID